MRLGRRSLGRTLGGAAAALAAVVGVPTFADATLTVNDVTQGRAHTAARPHRSPPETLVRVSVEPRRSSPVQTSVRRGEAGQLAGRLSRSELAELRGAPDPRAARALFARKQRERSVVLRELQPTAAATQRGLRPVVRAVRRLGGSVVGVDLLGASVTALVPREALGRLRRDEAVARVVPRSR